jgi:hypothetical protein
MRKFYLCAIGYINDAGDIWDKGIIELSTSNHRTNTKGNWTSVNQHR